MVSDGACALTLLVGGVEEVTCFAGATVFIGRTVTL